jgi:hypothetical protein
MDQGFRPSHCQKAQAGLNMTQKESSVDNDEFHVPQNDTNGQILT